MLVMTEAEIKAALSAIEAARRHQDTQLPKAMHAASAQIRSEAEKLLVPYLKNTGLDTTAFKALQELSAN
jgi:hypothetical protein